MALPVLRVLPVLMALLAPMALLVPMVLLVPMAPAPAPAPVQALVPVVKPVVTTPLRSPAVRLELRTRLSSLRPHLPLLRLLRPSASSKPSLMTQTMMGGICVMKLDSGHLKSSHGPWWSVLSDS